MKQIVQPLSGGPPEVLDVPRPVPDATEVLVQTLASVISPGTGRGVTALAQASLLAKRRRARPDLVRQMIRKAKAEGLGVARQAVRSRLAEDLPLGYSAAGVVLAAGPRSPGSGPVSSSPPAGQAKPATPRKSAGGSRAALAAVPDGVSARDAAFTTIAAIALHGLRLAEVGPGSKSRWSASAWSASSRRGWRSRPAVRWPASIQPSSRAGSRPGPGYWPSTNAARKRRTRSSAGPGVGVRTPYWSARQAAPRTR